MTDYKIIEVQKDEEITSLIDRIIQANESELVLSIPSGSRSLKSLVDFKLLKRETDALKKEISIISNDAHLQNLAKKVGLGVFGRSSVHTQIRKVYDIIPPSNISHVSIKELHKEETPELSLTLEEDRIAEQESKEPSYAEGTVRAGDAEHERSETTEIAKKSDILPEDESYLSEQFWKERKFESELKESSQSEKVERENTFNNFFAVAREKSQPSLASEVETHRTSVSKKKYIILAATAIILIGGMLFAFRGVDVMIVPQVFSINLDFVAKLGVKASSVDLEKGTAPAQIIKIEKTVSQTYDATGEKDVNEKAKGMIYVYNAYSSKSQFLKIDTRFSSPDGKIYKLTKGITVPGAKIENSAIIPSRILTEVVADISGSEYNIGPTKFTVPGFSDTPDKFKGFYGESEKNIAGGAKGRVKVVSDEDLKKAKSEVESKFSSVTKSELLSKLPQNLEFIDSGYKEDILESVSNYGVNQIQDNFEYKVRGQARVFMFNKEDIMAVAIANLRKEIKESDRVVDSSKKVTSVFSAIDWNEGQADLKTSFSAGYYGAIDEGGIVSGIAGKSEQAIFDFLLNNKAVGEAKVKFWPFFMKSAPASADRITLTVMNPE